MSALDHLLYNAHRAYMAERDMGHGRATIWRDIVRQDALELARELAGDGDLGNRPSLRLPKKTNGWRPSEDWQLAAAHDDTFSEP